MQKISLAAGARDQIDRAAAAGGSAVLLTVAKLR
jgi:hypothetical protein